MTQAVTTFRNDRYATSKPAATKPACTMIKSPSRSANIANAKTNSPNRRLFTQASLRVNARKKYTASRPIVNSSISDLLSDLNMLLKAGFDKVNKLRTYLLFGENRKRRQRKPFRGLHLLFGSHHSEVSGGQVMAACKDPVAPVALMTGGSFECAAAGLEGSITLPSKAHRSLGTSSVFSDLDPMPLGGSSCSHLDRLDYGRAGAHSAQAILADSSVTGSVNPRKGLPGLSRFGA